MRFSYWLTVSVVLSALPLSQAAAQTTIASNSGGGNNLNTYAPGQSFTTPTASPYYNNVAVSFQDSTGANMGAANSKLYLFSQEYGGTPSGLSSATSLGSATFANGVYTFDPTLTLSGNTKYFAYDDTVSNFAFSNVDSYNGGSLLTASSQNNGFVTYTNFDANFRVTAAAAATPEPAAWSLMILGFGVVGGTLRRHRRQAVTGDRMSSAA